MTHHTGPTKIKDRDHNEIIHNTAILDDITSEERMIVKGQTTISSNPLSAYREGFHAGWKGRAETDNLGGSVSELPPESFGNRHPHQTAQPPEFSDPGMFGERFANGAKNERIRWKREIDKMTDEGNKLGLPTLLILEALVKRMDNQND